MASNREGRMASRLRGAQRHQVEDVSFGFILPAPEAPPDAGSTIDAPAQSPTAASVPRSTPNTSAQRRRVGSKTSSAERTASHTSHTSTATRTRRTRPAVPPFPQAPASVAKISPAAAAPRADVYDMLQHTSSPENPSRPGTTSSKRSSALRRSIAQAVAADADDLESLPDSTPTQSRRIVRPGPRSSSSLRPPASATARPPASSRRLVTEEVGESPADAPGSGQRRVVMRGSVAVATSSVLLQRMVGLQDEADAEGETEDVGGLAQTSSPLTRKSNASTKGTARTKARESATRRSAGVEAVGTVDDVDELSPQTAKRTTRRSSGSGPADLDELSPENTSRSTRLSAGSVPDEVDELSPDKPVGAVGAQPAVSLKKTLSVAAPVEPPQTIPDRRPGRAGATKRVVEPKQQEPAAEDEAEEAQEIDEREAARRIGRKRPRRSIPDPSLEPEPQAAEEPALKRRRRKATESPAVQRHPRPAQKETRKPKGKPAKAAKRRNEAADELEGESGGTVPVTVQRFTRKVHYDVEDTGADILSSDIPFANRAGVNAVDVLSQLCEALADTFLSNLEERARSAGDGPAKREFRTMMRAVEAFREELRSRLLEQTIALDTLHSLQKRVRVAQKEKLTLREEILRIRAERDQVGLRMDAVRIKHEADSKEALRDIHLSSTMHDIDLVVEKGLAAPALPAAEEKEADLGNLELLISRVADQACTKSDGGGALRQIREFNAYLERAAAVLEGR